MDEKKHPFEEFLEQHVKVITTDGRVFLGNLKGLDQAMNIILAETEERIKDETKATIRCIPFGDAEEGTCIFTGKPSKGRVLFAKAY